MAYQFAKNGTLKDLTAEELAAADADSSVIELNQGILNDGTPYWAYIAVTPSRYKDFKRLTADHQPILLTEYGNILKFGFDDRVPTSVREEMKHNHGWDDTFLTTLAADVKAAQATFLKQQEDMRIADIVSMLKNNNLAAS